MGLAFFASRAGFASEPSLFSFERGIASTHATLNPGKLDFHYRGRSGESQYDGFVWTPVLKGGAGNLDVRNRPNLNYAGGFVRPFVTHPEFGDLILGPHSVESNARNDFEFQGEYRLPMGLGFGGGFVDPDPGSDITFGKLTFRETRGRWSMIIEAQAQEFGDDVSPGGYAALYDKHWMTVGGTDGEQWRATIGWLAPEEWKAVRPGVEVLYVDNTIGNFTGPRVLFANATLRYQGGFLSHAARLGRAMGPQGLEFGNPLGFLTPTWNRRLDVWEMGALLDLRAERVRFPNHATQERYEMLLFPAQLSSNRSTLDNFFAGTSYSKDRTRETAGVLGGFAGKVGFLRISGAIDHEFNPGRTTFIVGAIDAF